MQCIKPVLRIRIRRGPKIFTRQDPDPKLYNWGSGLLEENCSDKPNIVDKKLDFWTKCSSRPIKGNFTKISWHSFYIKKHSWIQKWSAPRSDQDPDLKRLVNSDPNPNPGPKWRAKQDPNQKIIVSDPKYR